eukprot:3131118-Rhodomonas_salina.1
MREGLLSIGITSREVCASPTPKVKDTNKKSCVSSASCMRVPFEPLFLCYSAPGTELAALLVCASAVLSQGMVA